MSSSGTSSMTMREFLEAARHNPLMRENAAMRLDRRVFVEPGFDVIRAEDDPQLARALEIPPGKVIRRYRAFADFFGLEREIEKLRKLIRAAASNTELNRQLAILLGPTASGKSAITTRLHELLRDSPIWALKGCPRHEHPFNLIPFREREYWAKELRAIIRPKADICPMCRFRLREQYGYEGGWLDFPVEELKISARRGIGSAIMFPTDPMNADTTKIVGRVNLAMLDSKEYPEGHPLTLLFIALAHQAEQGLFEVREIFKVARTIELLNPFIFATTDKELPGPADYGIVSVDFFIIGHSNVAEYRNFLADPTNEALVSRREIIEIRHVLRWSAEAQIYEKELRRTTYASAHRAPHMLEMVAKYAVASRIDPDHPFPLKLRLDIYNGDVEGSKTPSQLLTESPEDGMGGLDVRFFLKMLGYAYAAADLDADDGTEICVSWPDVHDEIAEALRSSDYAARDRERLQALLGIVEEWYRAALREEFRQAIIGVQEEYAENLFRNYIERARRLLSEGASRENAPLSPDEAFLRELEEAMGLDPTQVQGMRETFVDLYDEGERSGRPFTWRDDEDLRRGIEAMLTVRLRDLFVIPFSDERGERRQLAERLGNDLIERFGYCRVCSRKAIAYAAAHASELFV